MRECSLPWRVRAPRAQTTTRRPWSTDACIFLLPIFAATTGHVFRECRERRRPIRWFGHTFRRHHREAHRWRQQQPCCRCPLQHRWCRHGRRPQHQSRLCLAAAARGRRRSWRSLQALAFLTWCRCFLHRSWLQPADGAFWRSGNDDAADPDVQCPTKEACVRGAHTRPWCRRASTRTSLALVDVAAAAAAAARCGMCAAITMLPC
jgi:hypothetical protein